MINVNIGTLEKPVLRPALVVREWGHGCRNVQVFLDGSNDFEQVKQHMIDCGASAEIAEKEARHTCSRGTWWLTSINEGEGHHAWSPQSSDVKADEIPVKAKTDEIN